MIHRKGFIGKVLPVMLVVWVALSAYAYATGTLVQQHYRWRNDNGSESAATWKAAADTAATGVARGQNIRLRFCVAETSGSYAVTVAGRLEYATNTGGPWTSVSSDPMAAFAMTPTANYATSDATTNQLAGSGSWTPGVCVEGPATSTPSTTLAASTFSNFEYCLQPTVKAKGSTTYYFRLSGMSTYSKYATLTMAAGEAEEPPQIVSALTAEASMTAAFSYTIQATGSEPITYGASGLPSGLSLSAGTIAGQATQEGTYNVGLTATNAYGSSNKILVLTVVGNAAPVANNQANYSIVQGGEVLMILSWSDADNPAETDHTFTIVSGPSHGTLESYNVRNNQTAYPSRYYYRADAGYTGPDPFTWKCSDGDKDSNVATCTVTVKANTPPVAQNQTVTIASEARGATNLSKSDVDPGQTYTYALVNGASHGTVEHSTDTNQWFYTSSSGYVGQDSFTWKTNDGFDDSNVGTFTINVASNAPTANDQTVETVEGVLRGQFTLSYGDLDGGTMSFTLVSVPAHGTLEYNYPDYYTYKTLTAGMTATGNYAGRWYYTPDEGYVGQDSFTWKMSDGTSQSNTATCTLNVATNTPPVASNQTATVQEGMVVSMTPAVTDPDTQQTRTYTFVSEPAHGAVTVNSYYSNHTFYYAPTAGWYGTDTFTWRVYDGADYSNTATCTVTVQSDGSSLPPTVILVVKNTLYAEVESEVNRLKADLENEGHVVKINADPYANRDALRAYLDAQYNLSGQRLDGAILIGSLPLGYISQTTDYFYWLIESEGTRTRRIWTSRMDGTLQQIKWLLQANHDTRTGAHRLPHTAHWKELAFNAAASYYPNNGAAALDVWPEVQETHPLTAAIIGGDLIDEQAHSASHGLYNLAGHPAQARTILITSCGQANAAKYVTTLRGGGCVFSVGASTTTYGGAFIILSYGTLEGQLRARLAAGDSWGDALVKYHAFNDTARAIYYGDLSIGAMPAPSNEVPVVDEFIASATAGNAPLTVDFSASASDPDGQIVQHEWFVNGYNSGIDGPVYSTGTTSSVSHTYMTAHRYPAEVNVLDNYKAAAWKSATITVGPEPGTPIRINCGRVDTSVYVSGADYTDTSGNVWLHDQAYYAGTWGYQLSRSYKGTISGDIAGTEDDEAYMYYRTATASYPFTYRVPVENGSYKVTVGFAEPGTSTPAGWRMADVDLEGYPWLVGYDIVAEAGAVKTAVTVEAILDVTDGEMTIDVRRSSISSQDAVVNCITVEPYSSNNQPPVVDAYSPGTPHTMNEGTSRDFSVTASDSDGDELSYVWFLDDVALAGERAAVYNYAPDYYQAGMHTIKVQIDDWKGGRIYQMWDVEVVNVNGPAIAYDLEYQTLMDTPLAVTLNAVDPDGDSLTYVVVDAPDHGSLSGSGANLTYTPHSGYEGHDLFTYKATDGAHQSNVAEVKIRVGTPGEVIVETRDQFGAEVAGAEVYIRELALWYATGTKVALTVGNTYRFKTRIENITGPEVSVKIENATHEVTVDAWKATMRATDQHGANVTDGLVYVKNATNAPYTPGTEVTLPKNVNVYIYGRVPNINGPQMLITWGALDEIDPGFWTATLVAKDQNGDDVTFAEILVRYLPVEWLAPGTEVTLPKGYNATTQGRVSTNLAGPYVYFVFTDGLTEVNPGFQTFTVKCRDQNNNVVPDGQAHIRYYVPEYHADGAVLTVPRDDDVSTRSRRLNLYANVYDTTRFSSDVTEFNAKFRAVRFKGVATNGTTIVPGADVELYGSSIPKFANNSVQGVPYDDTVRVRIFKDGIVIGDLNPATIAAGTTEVVVTTSWVDPGGNHAPVAQDQSVTTPEETVKSITLTATDSEGDTLTYEVLSSPSHGSLSGTAPNVTYTPVANYVGGDSFTFRANDGQADSNTATVTISVTNVNDAPVANNDSATTGEDVAVTINVLANDTDIDGDTLSVASVTNPPHGSAVKSGSNVVYTPDAGYFGSDSFSYTASDGNGGTDTATVSVTVTEASNTPPVAQNQSVSTNEDTAKAITLVATDGDNDTLTYSVTANPAHGTLSGSGASRTYAPAANYHGSDSFKFKANDGKADSNIATVSITVTPVNDAPVANNDSASTAEDTAVTINVLANDTDVDGDTLSVASVTNPPHGSAVKSGSNVVYTPDANYNGSDSFSYTVSDGNGGTDTATVSMTVTPVNDAPVANNDSASTAEDTAVTINVLANDTDVDGDTLSVASVTDPPHGSAVKSGSSVVYTPDTGCSGTDTFSYTVSDGKGGTDTATVTVNVSDVNEAPVAQNQSVTTNEDTSKAIALVATDGDGDSLTYAIVSSPSHGGLSGTAPNVTYTPNADYHGADSFTFRANDGQVNSNVATVSITVNPVNDAPVAVDDSAVTDEDAAATIAVVANDTDIEGDVLCVDSVTQPAHGSAAIVGCDVSYTPDANYHGSDSFTYVVSDSKGGTDVGTVSMTVSAVNDAPVANNDSASTAEDTAVTINVLANDSDVDGDTLSVASVTNPPHGSAVKSGSNVVYTPDAGYSGTDSFSYTVSDGNGGTDTATVTVNVSDVNEAPVAQNQSVSVDEDDSVGIALVATDGDGDSLTYSIVSGPSHGGLSGTAPNVTYTPNADYHGADSFTFRANDGQVNSNVATVSITVNPVNDAPVANNDSASTAEDTAVTVNVLANDTDVDGDALAVASVTNPPHGSAVKSGSNVVYTPDAGYSGTDSFSYTVSDGNGGTDTATVTVNVSDVNEAPVAQNQSVSVDEDDSGGIALVATDGDNDTLTYSIVSGPANGALSGTAPNVTYTPAADYNGADSFTFRANDGQVDSNVATVSITVNPVNDAPVANNDSGSTNKDTAVDIDVLANDTDIDGDTLSVASVTQGANGSVVSNGTNVTYTPDAGFSGTDTFTYAADDGTAESAAATVTVTVKDVIETGNLYVTCDNGYELYVNGELIGTGSNWQQADIYSVDIIGGENVIAVKGTDSGGAAAIIAELERASGRVGTGTQWKASTSAPAGWETIGFDDSGWASATDYGAYGVAPWNTSVSGFPTDTPAHWIWTSDNSGDDVVYARLSFGGDGNTAPVAEDQEVETDEDVPVDIVLVATDADDDMLTYFIVDGPANGALSGTAPNVTYTPNADYSGQDQFTFKANDGEADSNVATVSITVHTANDAPTAVDDAVTTVEDTAVTVDVLANDSDPEGDALVVGSVTQPANGTVVNNGTSVTYTPDLNFYGVDTLTYTADDGKGGQATATVTVTVTAVNDPPIAVAAADPMSGSAPLTVTLDGSGSSDPEGIQDYEWDLGDGASAYGATATHTYTAAGTYEVTLYVFDTAGLNDSASLSITVVVNTAPVAEGQTVNTREDAVTPITLVATDAEGDALSYAVVALPAHGDLTGTGPDVVYTPDENYFGTDSFTFKADDGKFESNVAVVNVNVVPMNDAPVARDQSVSTGVDKPVDITLGASDTDGDALTYSLVDLPANGSVLSDDGDRYVTYSPDSGFSGQDSFSFVATDGLADSNTATVTVDVSGNLVDIVSVSTGKAYSLATAQVGALYYIDRSYMIEDLSANLDGMVLVRTANNDKRVKTEQHLTLQLGQDAVLSVCYDKRASAVPSWLASGWTLTGEVMAVSDRKASPMLVYEKTVAAGQVVLGGNLAAGASGAKSNYVVVVRPVTAMKSDSGDTIGIMSPNIKFVVGPLAPEEWLNDGDTDGDGLQDEFENLYGVDPQVVDTDADGVIDENETGPDGRSLWDIQEEWAGDDNDPDDGSDGGGGSGGGCFLSTASLKRSR